MVVSARRRRTLAFGFVASLLPLFALFSLGGLGACTSSDEGDGEKAPPHPACPASLDQAIGASCANEGLACPIGYPCEPFLPEQAHCTCTGGKFACTDSRGAALADGVTPACVSRAQGGNAAACPADEATAAGASCKLTGLECAYAGATCPDESAPQIDTCICAASGGSVDASPELRFQCRSRGCNPRSDGGVTPRDARADAPDGGG